MKQRMFARKAAQHVEPGQRITVLWPGGAKMKTRVLSVQDGEIRVWSGHVLRSLQPVEIRKPLGLPDKETVVGVAYDLGVVVASIELMILVAFLTGCTGWSSWQAALFGCVLGFQAGIWLGDFLRAIR